MVHKLSDPVRLRLRRPAAGPCRRYSPIGTIPVELAAFSVANRRGPFFRPTAGDPDFAAPELIVLESAVVPFPYQSKEGRYDLVFAVR